ncbi:MAG: helix-turn-helix transcriptional regulator [Candidatus Izemoplasmatales bacterium]|nr:helix-turn-helix transcriptional regulator [Candidatus Izemoplasmatales bacterium]
MYLWMDIIKRINDLLVAKYWSIHQLFLECDASRSTLYRIMAHELSPTFAQIEKICDAFNISVEDFFCVSNAPKADEVILLKNFRELSKDGKKTLLLLIQGMNN